MSTRGHVPPRPGGAAHAAPSAGEGGGTTETGVRARTSGAEPDTDGAADTGAGGDDTSGQGEEIHGIALCATVPPVQHEMREMFHRHYPGVPAVVVEPGVRTGVPIRVDNPKEVGSDRIVNTLAAVRQFGGPCVIVDFGTATIFDAVSAKGEYLGGAIAPGIDISVEALSQRGSQLHMVEIVKPRSSIAKSTAEALRSGIVFGFAGQVDGLVERMARELGAPEDVTVVATGDLASIVVHECRRVDVHEPWLTLNGLRLVYERNAPTTL
ncbi:type III pantothenate kinase [Spiractinospora alimapuensis]|nr:type III pantothenate kinase [Spiractinospora alimapuensis]